MAGKTFAGLNIGILALQGDVSLHAAVVHQLGIEPHLVKLPAQLKDLDGLIIPGGESTTLLKLCEPLNMLPAITQFAKNGGHIFGTCAGAILLARQVTNPVQTSLNLIDITIERNAYGRQLDSTEATGQAKPPLGTNRLPLTFIRAPRITATGPAVTILATHHDEPVLVQQANILAATFHPELSTNHTIYTYWLATIR